VDLIKLHRFSGKVSYLACPKFDSDPHPITTKTTKVWLRTLRVGYYDTSSRINPPLLDRKDEMVDAQYESKTAFERLTKQEQKQGLLRDGEDFLSQAVWQGRLATMGLQHRGHRLVKAVEKMTDPKVSLPKRFAKYGVGKSIGGAVYVHRQYEHVLGDALRTAKKSLPSGFEYTVVKHNEINGNLSFIHCPDFDTADEPATGDYAVVHPDGVVKLHPALADPYIYHHKWLFVAEDYEGFDLEASVRRSIAWMSLPDVDKSLIGRASYWNKHVVPRLNALDTSSASTDSTINLERPDRDSKWVKSDVARKILKLTPCELAHLRQSGGINFRKVGRSFEYLMD